MNMFGRDADLPPGVNPEDVMTEDELSAMEKLAKKTVHRGMSVPAILFLESIKPLNFITSQVMVFFEPIIQTVFNFKDYDNFRTALEKRQSIEILIRKIEAHDSVALRKEKAFKKWYRQEKKTWKWYQRYLGIKRPKLDVPEEVLNPPDPAEVAKQITKSDSEDDSKSE